MSGQPVSVAPGYFGKVASHGDFVARRLPPDFIAAWDLWLQAGMRHSREQLAERWLEIYLNSPIWHFALGAGVCGRAAMAGVFMPSVDRVGRYFPLTLAACALEEEGDAPRGGAWYQRLEELALASLAPGHALGMLDHALAALGADVPPPCAPAPGRALFWTTAASASPAGLLTCTQLPSPARFRVMLGGG